MASRSTDPRQLLPLLLALALGACTPKSAAPPAPLPRPPAPPAPAAAPTAGDWLDWPLAPGNWRYVPGTPISSARFGQGASAQFLVQCDARVRRVTVVRAGSTSELAITTSTRTVRFPAGQMNMDGIAMSGVILNASDGFLDEMLFSRGRIAVQSPGLDNLAIPTWAEPARVVEDCRR